MGCNFSKKAVKIVSRKASDCTTNNNASTPEPEIKSTEPGSKILPTQSELETNIQTIIKDTEKLPENGTAAKKTANGNDTMNQSQPMDTVSFSEHIPDGNTTPNLRLPNQTSDVRNEEQPRSLPNLDRNQSGAESQKHHLTTNIYQLNTKRPVKNGSSLQSNSTDFQRTTKHSPFGPRSSRLVLTQSQIDFFRMVDEKVAQGKDYCSDDDLSIASIKSWNRKDSASSNGLTMKIPQKVS